MKNIFSNKRKWIILAVTIIVFVFVWIDCIIYRTDDELDIDAYNSESSYILSAEQIDAKVTNELEAKKLLSDFELGDEYTLINTFDFNYALVYHFQESYKGVPVHGRYSNVITSSDTTAQGISSNYYPINIDISPRLNEEEALGLCRQHFDQLDTLKNDLFTELCIYGYDDIARLSYCIHTGAKRIYIDADTGEIIHEFDNLQNSKCTLIASRGEVEVDVKEVNGSYELFDSSRGGGIESCILPDSALGICSFEKSGCTRVVTTPEESKDFAFAIDALYNIERAYDYYAQVHNFYSTDGKDNRRIYIVNNVEGYMSLDEKRPFSDNAAEVTFFNDSGQEETWIIISKENSSEFLYSYYLDVMAHEYTHGVMYSLAGDAENRQMKALGEAYADIMAICCEEYYHEGNNWKVADLRDIPTIAMNKDAGKCISHIDQYSPTLEVHEASTVISSAAYYMYTGLNEEGENDSRYAIHSYETLSKLWFASMLYLNPSSDFVTCRYAVECAADLLTKAGIISSQQAQGVRYAFDKVGLKKVDIKKSPDDLTASNNFSLRINDRTDEEYTECDIRITCIFQKRNYKGHSIGLQYQHQQEEIYNGYYGSYPQQQIEFEDGSIYLIEVTDRNSFIKDSFRVYIDKKGPKELILKTSIPGYHYNSFDIETESSEEILVHEDDQTNGFVLPNPYPEGYESGNTAFDDLFSGHFANMSAPMGIEPGSTYESSKKFALKASYDVEDPQNGPYYLIIADMLGNVYDLIPISKYPKEANGWLRDDVFYSTNNFSASIMKQGGDITDNFFEGRIDLVDIVNDSNGILFFTVQITTNSPYESEDTLTDAKYEVWDDSGNVIISFYKNELANKYGIEAWLGDGTFHLVNLGGGIYHMSDQINGTCSDQYAFLDVNRKKAIAIALDEVAEYDEIESDGNYILIPHSRAKSATIIDLETEELFYIENVEGVHGIGEGKFFTDTCCYNVQGDVLYKFENVRFDGKSIKIKSITPYHNGIALLIIDDGTYYQSAVHEFDIGFIDESGNTGQEIASLTSAALNWNYIPLLNTYCLFTREGSGGFLIDGSYQPHSQPIHSASSEDQYFGVIDGDNKFILRYGYIDRGNCGYNLFLLN